MNGAMAREVESFRETQAALAAEEEGPILVLTADGKGVPMRRDASVEEVPSEGRRRKGEKANKKRMAVYGRQVSEVAQFAATDVRAPTKSNVK